jgi:hypothetical protein
MTEERVRHVSTLAAALAAVCIRLLSKVPGFTLDLPSHHRRARAR